MTDATHFDFNNKSIAKSYDSVLVPSLFLPWAKQLIDDCKPLKGKQVLELACGTGVVTKELTKSVVPFGKVIALDINSEMLNIAKEKCKDSNSITFILSSADALSIQSNSLDVVLCQQGFQFFPNKKDCATEIFRVLKPNGKVVITTWCAVDECEIFELICETLDSIGKVEISQLMRIPFDIFTKDQLFDAFDTIGFSSIKISKETAPLFLNGGINNVINFAYATPIGPKLRSLSTKDQNIFQTILIEKSANIQSENGAIGKMTTNKLVAIK